MPKIDQLVDATVDHPQMSFLDAFQGYHQIPLALDVQEKTASVTPVRNYHYKVMPFGLKNASSTYQRMMTRMFESLLGKNIEIYIDDMVVKSKMISEHLRDFSTITFSEDVRTNPTPEPFGFDAPSTCTSHVGGQYWEIVSTNFSSLSLSASNSSTSGLVNSATKSARTCPFKEVRGMYLISKALRIVPHLAILPV